MDTEDQQGAVKANSQIRFWTEDSSFLQMQEEVLLNQCSESSPFLACSKMFEHFTDFTPVIGSQNTKQATIDPTQKQQHQQDQCSARHLKRRFLGIHKKHLKAKKYQKAKLIKEMQGLTF